MSKRKEAPAASPSYSRGAIVRIRLHNFMSYRDAEIADVGTKLNCIIGPNGTGKSSIVCAMCVGLGGSLGVTFLRSYASFGRVRAALDGATDATYRSAPAGKSAAGKYPASKKKREGTARSPLPSGGVIDARWSSGGAGSLPATWAVSGLAGGEHELSLTLLETIDADGSPRNKFKVLGLTSC